MGLLSGNGLQRIFGRAFKGVFAQGVIVHVRKNRQPNGTLRSEVMGRHVVSVQFDSVTEAMRSTQGYSATDMRVIILRHDLDLDLTEFSSDCIVAGNGYFWSLSDVTTDPARSYFEARGSMKEPLPPEASDLVSWANQVPVARVIQWFSMKSPGDGQS